jgi:hypothetical protein
MRLHVTISKCFKHLEFYGSCCAIEDIA